MNRILITAVAIVMSNGVEFLSRLLIHRVRAADLRSLRELVAGTAHTWPSVPATVKDCVLEGLSTGCVMASPQTASLHSSPELSLEETVRSLSRECAFPVPVDVVGVRQTHISTVFLGVSWSTK